MLSLQLEINLDAVVECARLGREHKKTVVLKTSPLQADMLDNLRSNRKCTHKTRREFTISLLILTKFS